MRVRNNKVNGGGFGVLVGRGVEGGKSVSKKTII